MNLKSALRLKPGSIILVGSRNDAVRIGRVLHVTPRGGIRIEVGCYARWKETPPGTVRYAGETWVPYSQVIQILPHA